MKPTLSIQKVDVRYKLLIDGNPYKGLNEWITGYINKRLKYPTKVTLNWLKSSAKCTFNGIDHTVFCEDLKELHQEFRRTLTVEDGRALIAKVTEWGDKLAEYVNKLSDNDWIISDSDDENEFFDDSVYDANDEDEENLINLKIHNHCGYVAFVLNGECVEILSLLNTLVELVCVDCFVTVNWDSQVMVYHSSCQFMTIASDGLILELTHQLQETQDSELAKELMGRIEQLVAKVRQWASPRTQWVVSSTL